MANIAQIQNRQLFYFGVRVLYTLRHYAGPNGPRGAIGDTSRIFFDSIMQCRTLFEKLYGKVFCVMQEIIIDGEDHYMLRTGDRAEKKVDCRSLNAF
jgi:hypothetical protein